MKSVVVTFALLLGTGWLSVAVDTRPSDTAKVTDFGSDGWRRTVDGWENANAWHVPQTPKYDVAAIHPTMVAAFMFLACVAALVAYCPSMSDSTKLLSEREVRIDAVHRHIFTRRQSIAFASR